MLNRLLSTLYLPFVVHALDIEPPFSHANNTWYVEDIEFSRIINSTGGVNASFSIYRTYYEECIPPAPDGLQKLLVCGWMIVNSPLSCYPTDYADAGALDLTNPPQERWYTCHERPKAPESERIVSEDEKQWVKWRSFGLQELDASQLTRDDRLAGGPFQNVSFEFINGIRTHKNGSRLPADQIRVIKTTFSAPKSWMTCWLPDRPYGPSGRFPANSRWFCKLKHAMAIGEPGHYCTGLGGLTNPCGFLTATSESLTSLSEFKKKYR